MTHMAVGAAEVWNACCMPAQMAATQHAHWPSDGVTSCAPPCLQVLSDVLDTAPAVAWEDVAGLGTAKQARGVHGRGGGSFRATLQLKLTNHVVAWTAAVHPRGGWRPKHLDFNWRHLLSA